jgi:hypothetical protein
MKKQVLRPKYGQSHITQICQEGRGFRKTIFVALWNCFSPEERKRFLELTRLELKPIPITKGEADARSNSKTR